ncbi:uncharacterized protein BT62DRAFT_1011591 [Guyanagaster necrorhizus]|uniref:Uncharacterized protein n=1 Tax=Guyanagaster necrorhizus TaxID=856835 RepID=A0A9P7VIT1_9AGAR|nr:uncharacterized protein BT62DRAFT_1011591 [Guyanagaster necrorhizus MCA 3950]KAG7441353.1 hypothetical protein BT62DRAFT_1011591 [Guyanagaster necrorhizus MCA 3950]
MFGSTYQLCSTGNVAIPGDWSMSPTRAACRAQENTQGESSVSESLSDLPSLPLDSMALDGGRADSGADEHTVVNLDPADELSTGDRSADHPRVDMGQDTETGPRMPEVPVMEPPSEVVSDTGPQEGDPVMLPEHNNPVLTGGDPQGEGDWMTVTGRSPRCRTSTSSATSSTDNVLTPSHNRFVVLDEEHLHEQPELTSAQLSTIQQAEALIPDETKEIMDRHREAMGLANQPVPSSSPDARPQDKGKIVDYHNKLAMLPGFTSNDFNVNNQHRALSFWEALQNESTEVQCLLLEEAATRLQ